MSWTGWGGSERQRDGEEDKASAGWKMRRLYGCAVGRGLRGFETISNARALVRAQLAGSGLVLVSCPWSRRAQESAVSL